MHRCRDILKGNRYCHAKPQHTRSTSSHITGQQVLQRTANNLHTLWLSCSKFAAVYPPQLIHCGDTPARPHHTETGSLFRTMEQVRQCNLDTQTNFLVWCCQVLPARYGPHSSGPRMEKGMWIWTHPQSRQHRGSYKGGSFTVSIFYTRFTS